VTNPTTILFLFVEILTLRDSALYRHRDSSALIWDIDFLCCSNSSIFRLLFIYSLLFFFFNKQTVKKAATRTTAKTLKGEEGEVDLFHYRWDKRRGRGEKKEKKRWECSHRRLWLRPN
jgi:hypothetical protein